VSIDSLWPLLALAALGAYHGINPAMGWLFAVSQGMQEGERRAVLRSLAPIALGHEASIVLVAGVVIVAEETLDPAALHIGAAAVLFAFGVFRFLKPRAHWRWTTMRVNRRELTLWSFLMSTAHGAGLMVAPVLIGAGAASTAAADVNAHVRQDAGMASAASIPADALGLLVHVGAMLLVMGVVAVLVYEKLGVEILRRTWVNTDHVWAGAFVFSAGVTLFTA
jgi:hypothetical protein